MNRFVLKAMSGGDSDEEGLIEDHIKLEDAYAADADFASLFIRYAVHAHNEDPNSNACWIDKYFEYTGENKQDYIDVINEGK